MAKRGQRQPYKVQFQYPCQPKYKRAMTSRDQALQAGRDIARRGAAVRVFHRDPDTGAETDIASYDIAAWEAQAQRALDALNAKGAPASADLAELHDVDAAAYTLLIEALVAMAPVTGEDVEPEHIALAGLRPATGGLFDD